MEIVHRLNHPDTNVRVKHLRTNADKNVSGRTEETVSQSKSGNVNTKLDFVLTKQTRFISSDRVISLN